MSKGGNIRWGGPQGRREQGPSGESSEAVGNRKSESRSGSGKTDRKRRGRPAVQGDESEAVSIGRSPCPAVCFPMGVGLTVTASQGTRGPREGSRTAEHQGKRGLLSCKREPEA